MVNCVKFAYLLFFVSYIGVVRCKERKARTTPATAESVVQFVDIQDCSTLSDGIYADPTDCHRYYHCYSGKTYYFRCYEGFVFHPCQLKCVFRDACMSPESCHKSNKTTTESVTKRWPFDEQAVSSEDGTTRAGQRRLLRLANSTPLIKSHDGKFSTVTTLDTEIEEKTTKQTNKRSTTTTAGHTKPASKKHIPALTTEVEPSTSRRTTTTTEATQQTYIVKVVFARRNQPGAQANEIEQNVESFTISPATKTSLLDTTESTTTAKLDNRIDENPDATINDTDTNAIFIGTKSPDRENITTDFNRTNNNNNLTSADGKHLNNSLATKFSEEFNVSSIENITESNLTSTHVNFTSTVNETRENETTKLELSTLSVHNTSLLSNDSLSELNETTTTTESTNSTAEESATVVIDSNALEPVKNFIKNKISSKEKEKSGETTEEALAVSAGKSATEFVESTTVDNVTLSSENATATFLNGSLASNVSSANDSKLLLEDHVTSVEDINSTSTVELSTSGGEIFNNITLSCHPTISSAMCETFSNQTREAVARKCHDLACQNGGMFISLSNGHCGCVCPHGLKGDNCQNVVDRSACRCANGGRCVQVTNDTYTCMCPLSLLGANCQYSMSDIHPKVSNLIQLNNSPPPTRNTPAGGIGNLSNYVLCSTNVCHNGGLCLQNLNNFSQLKCFCSDNYGGQFCEKKFE